MKLVEWNAMIGFMCNRFDRLWNFELRLFDALNRWHCTSWNFKLFFILIEPRITNLTATCFTFSYFIINSVSFLKVNLKAKRKCLISLYRTSLLVFCKNIDMHPSHIKGNVITHKRKLIYLKVLYSFEGTWNLLFPLSKTAKILTATGLLLC